MINFTLKTVAINEVDFSDRLFRISTTPSKELVDSVRKVGLTSPPILQQQASGRYRIVAGFRRLEALELIGLRDFQALIAGLELSPIKLFEIAIYDNMSIRQLNPIEISNILNKLEYKFNLPDNDIVDRFLPMLGLGKNARVLAIYIPLAILEKPLQNAVATNQLSLQIASQMALATPDERSHFFELVQKLHLGKNKQKEFWHLIHDICLIEKSSISQIVTKPQVQKLLIDSKKTPSQRADELKHFLYQFRYPRFTYTETRYQEIIGEMRLPPHIQFRPAPFFEGDRFTVQFSFKTNLEYHQIIDFLKELGQNGLPEKLVSLAGNEE